MEKKVKSEDMQLQSLIKQKEKPRYLLRAIAGLGALVSLVLLFFPWLEVHIAAYEFKVGALQIITSNFSIDGQLISYPFLSKLSLVIGLVLLIFAFVSLLKKRYLLAGFAGLVACIALIVTGAALAPLSEALQNATGTTLGIEEQAYSVGLFQSLSFLAAGILTVVSFVLYSAERFAKQIFLVAACISIAMVFLITAYLLVLGMPAIAKIGPINFLFGSEWKPTHSTDPKFGILNMILASVFATFGAVIIGVPVGIFTAVFLAELAPKWLRAIVRPAVELLAGIPSVIYGFFAMQLIVPAIQDLFKLSSGATLLSSIIVLSIMILPTIVTTAETGLRAVPPIYKEASLALGASHTRTIFKVLLPAARTTVLSGVILGVGRAIGETMAIIMVAGGMANFPTILGSVRPLTVGIVMEMSYASGLHRESLFAIGLVLFLFIMAVNLSFTKLSKQGVQMDA